MAIGLLVFVVQRGQDRAHRAARRRTTRGSPTRSSGTRRRRRRPTTSTASRTWRARARCATCAAGSRRPDVHSAVRPGPWLRLTALFAALATLLAVVSGAASLGAAHRLLAALALPPLVALVVAAPARASPAAPAGRLRARALRPGRAGHDPRRAPGAGWARLRRLSRPDRRDVSRRARAARVRARLRHADQAADHVAPAHHRPLRDVRRGRRRAVGVARRRDHDGARPRLRRRVGAQPRHRPRHRQADGEADAGAAGRSGADASVPRARVRPDAVGVLVRPARVARQPADRRARPRRKPLLRPRLHAVAEALDAAEHRHRRRSGRRAAARRLVGRDGQPDAAGALALPDRLLLDAAALLGARAPDQARLRGGADPDAPGRPRRARDRAADPPLRRSARRRDTRTVPLGAARPRVSRRRDRARRGLRAGLRCACGASGRRGAHPSSSITPCSTSPCSSSPWRSTHSCSARAAHRAHADAHRERAGGARPARSRGRT